VNKLGFGSPLYFYLDSARPELGMRELVDVDEGLAALHGGELRRYRFAGGGVEREAWGSALFALTNAKFHPRPKQTEAARSALRRLALAAGALVTIRSCETARSARGSTAGERVVWNAFRKD
jgi:hypothetical protein